MMGSSNAVNLTDGLDGLAIVPVMMAAASLGFIAYVAGNFNFAVYLQLHHVVMTNWATSLMRPDRPLVLRLVSFRKSSLKPMAP